MYPVYKMHDLGDTVRVWKHAVNHYMQRIVRYFIETVRAAHRVFAVGDALVAMAVGDARDCSQALAEMFGETRRKKFRR